MRSPPFNYNARPLVPSEHTPYQAVAAVMSRAAGRRGLRPGSDEFDRDNLRAREREEADMGELQVESTPPMSGWTGTPRPAHHLSRRPGLHRPDPGWLASFPARARWPTSARAGTATSRTALPVETDTIFRIYSMTKPITSVAAMMLLRGGRVRAERPGRRLIPVPRHAGLRRRLATSSRSPTRPPSPSASGTCSPTPPGLTYGFHHVHPVDALLPRRPATSGARRRTPTSPAVDALASLPLLFQPGTEWNYSVATDVLGRLVEVPRGSRSTSSSPSGSSIRSA